MFSGGWACSAGYDLRIIFDFVKEGGKKEEDIFLIEMGTRVAVYFGVDMEKEWTA